MIKREVVSTLTLTKEGNRFEIRHVGTDRADGIKFFILPEGKTLQVDYHFTVDSDGNMVRVFDPNKLKEDESKEDGF